MELESVLAVKYAASDLIMMLHFIVKFQQVKKYFIIRFSFGQEQKRDLVQEIDDKQFLRKAAMQR